MSGTDDRQWSLQDFLLRLDAWVEVEEPLDELRVRVADWMFTRMQDPFSGARRSEGFSDYWEAVIPGSEHFDKFAERSVVMAFFWVDVRARTVRCDRIASLSLPV